MVIHTVGRRDRPNILRKSNGLTSVRKTYRRVDDDKITELPRLGRELLT